MLSIDRRPRTQLSNRNHGITLANGWNSLYFHYFIGFCAVVSMRVLSSASPTTNHAIRIAWRCWCIIAKCNSNISAAMTQRERERENSVCNFASQIGKKQIFISFEIDMAVTRQLQLRHGHDIYVRILIFIRRRHRNLSMEIDFHSETFGVYAIDERIFSLRFFHPSDPHSFRLDYIVLWKRIQLIEVFAVRVGLFDI